MTLMQLLIQRAIGAVDDTTALHAGRLAISCAQRITFL
jgi:hypothetical protein